MNKNTENLMAPDQMTFRMRPGLFKLQVGFCLSFAIFCLAMVILLLWRHEKTAIEYFFWIAGFGLWLYAIWYAISARLSFDRAMIQFTAARTKVSVPWHQIAELGFEASGPVLYVQEPNQAQEAKAAPLRKNKRKKIPLYLFMDKWKTNEDWNRDPVGKELLKEASWIFQKGLDK